MVELMYQDGLDSEKLVPECLRELSVRAKEALRHSGIPLVSWMKIDKRKKEKRIYPVVVKRILVCNHFQA